MPTRRQILLAATTFGAALVAKTLPLERIRFVATTAMDRLYGRFARRPLQRAAAHPVQYVLSLPWRRRDASPAIRPRALVIALDGADHDFQGYHAAFVRARRDLPFVLVTPLIVSNGGRPRASDYPYATDVLDVARADPLGFDVSGVAEIIRDLRARFGSALPVFVSGFSAGGHLAWVLLRKHPDWFSGFAFASANFAGRGLAPDPIPVLMKPVPARAFFGAADKRFDILVAQWELGKVAAEAEGFDSFTQVVVPGAGHSPFAREVLEYFAGLAFKM